MSSGTGRATSQKSGIGGRINYASACADYGPAEKVGILDCVRHTFRFGCASFGMTLKDLAVLLWWFHSEILHHHLQIFPGFAFLARITQQERRMISHDQLRPLPCRIAAARAGWHEVVEAAAQF